LRSNRLETPAAKAPAPPIVATYRERVAERAPDTAAVATLRQYVEQAVGANPDGWPGGWPGEIEAGLIDAVFSVRAKYGSRTRKTGVYGAVWRWRERRGVPANDLRVLAATSADELLALTNKGKISGRHKAVIVLDAATRLVTADVVTDQDFARKQDDAKAAYLSTSGCGPVTWSYFRMLLGIDDVKPDTWVMRFVNDRLPNVKNSAEAALLVKAVAAELGVEAHAIDHAIWRYRRSQQV
jgi:hypothetical protein